ncbi:MAG TPA: ABC transporter permease, partial [Acidimicrobiales bacterium]
MSNTHYLRYEVLRTYRNRRFLIFSLIFPLILFLVVAGPNRHARLIGVSFPLYYMSGMVAWGCMVAVISSGGRIAVERTVGWTRQLRITPLRTSAYFTAKILCGYLMAILSMVVLYAAGTSVGVRLSAKEWLVMSGLVLVGLIPFAVLGVAMGHLLTPDSLGPALGGATSLLALLGGAYSPLVTSGVLFTLIKLLPSYWLVQAGRTAVGGGGWPLEGWLVVLGWSVVLSVAAVRIYRRDTRRI